jgi:hypothetical protein
MAAATLDPGRRVQEWVKQALWERPVQPDRFNDLTAMVRGEAPVDAVLAAMRGQRPPKQQKKRAAGNDSVETGEDLDANGNAVDGGDVEFYQNEDEDADGTKQQDDRPDPNTFEYSQ